MKLSDKIIELRKSNAMSQEALSEKLGLSRQAVSRWEMGSAMPDATNLLQLSKLFGVTADYLLNDAYESDNDLPKIKEMKSDNLNQIMIWLIAIELMTLLMQFMATVFLRSAFFGFLSFIPFAALIGGFEYAYHKRAGEANEMTVLFRKRFHKISAFLGLYFPIRFVTDILAGFYPRPHPPLIFECIVLIVYLGAATLVTLSIEEKHLLRTK